MAFFHLHARKSGLMSDKSGIHNEPNSRDAVEFAECIAFMSLTHHWKGQRH